MHIKIKPASSAYYNRIKGDSYISAVNIGNLSVLEEGDRFRDDNSGNKEGKESVAEFNKLAVIDLPVHVPNFFLDRSGNNSLLHKLITNAKTCEFMPQTEDEPLPLKGIVTDLVEGRKVIDLSSNTFLSLHDDRDMELTFDIERHLLSGDAILYLIDSIDWELELGYEVHEQASKCATRALKAFGIPMKDVKIRVTKSPTNLHFFDEYYADILFSDGYTHVTDEIAAKFRECVRKFIVEDFKNSRLRYLIQINTEEGFSNFKNLLQNKQAVLPVGSRVGKDGKRSPTTVRYYAFLSSVTKLDHAIKQRGIKLSEVTNAYNEFLKEYKLINVDKASKSINGFKSHSESLNGKQGLIRSKLLSSIVDNAGRSVIIVDPKLSIDTVGIPYTMLRELCDELYMKFLKLKFNVNRSIFESRETNDGKTYKFHNKRYLDELAKFKDDANFHTTKIWLDKLCGTGNYVEDSDYKLIREICPDFRVVIGRQPTLYRIGIQAFKCKPVEQAAIFIPSLSVVAFNADFDGDQMHTNTPISLAAQAEVVSEMTNVKNIYLPKNGECHIYPRHENLYGLWYASIQKPTGKIVIDVPKLNFEVKSSITDLVVRNKAKLTDIVRINGREWSLGQAVIKCCHGVEYSTFIIGDKQLRRCGTILGNTDLVNNDIEEGVFTDDWAKRILTKLNDEVRSNDAKIFVNICNEYLKIGNAVAKYYPPTLSLMQLPDIIPYIEEFNEKVKELQFNYEFGFDNKDGYESKYSTIYHETYDEIASALFSKGSSIYLGDNNGFLQLAKSHARGSKSTTMQIFGIKGIMQKDSKENFASVIENSMSRGLNSLEHLVTAYGGRRGQIDKSIQTSEPGYVSRKCWHVACSLVITENDCGTSDGILIDYKFLEMMAGSGSNSDIINLRLANSMFAKFVVGRYIVEKSDRDVSEEDIEDIFRTFIADYDVSTGQVIVKGGVHLRSPLTCKNPCCQRCYGRDLGHHSNPKFNKTIGFEAATAIGEPAAQLTMNNFHAGGIASSGNITSSFELIEKYIDMSEFEPINGLQIVDYMSPFDADIDVTYSDGGRVKVVTITPVTENSGYKRKVLKYSSSVEFKTHVKKGEGICVDTGNFDIRNVMEAIGVDEAARYLTFKLWDIFSSQDVDLKHFECVVSCMVMYVCTMNVGEFKAGSTYTAIDWFKNGGYKYSSSFYKIITGAKDVLGRDRNSLRGFFMESQSEHLSHHILGDNEDELGDLITRIGLGLPLLEVEENYAL